MAADGANLNLKVHELVGWKLECTAYLISNISLLRKKMAKDEGFLLLSEMNDIEETPVSLAIHPHYIGSPEDTGLSLIPAKLDPNHKSDSPYLSFWNYHDAYMRQDTTPVQVAEKLLQTIDRHNNEMHWLRFLDKDVLKNAKESTERYKSGAPLSQLDGVFVSVKESINIKGIETKMGTCFINDGEPAQSDSTIVSRLRRAGAIVIGSSIMDELGWNTLTVNPHTGTPKNPFKLSHSCGGSSGGSSGIVSAGIIPVSIGTDAGGSVRIPSSFCGLYGLKTTCSRISGFGGAKIEPTVNAYGPLAATADDMALTYSIIAGPDPNDTNTLFQPSVSLKDYNKYRDLSDLTIGIVPEWNKDAAEPVILEKLESLKTQLGHLGARFVEVELNDLSLYKIALYVTVFSEMSNYANRFPENKSNYLGHTRISVELASVIGTKDYLRAQQVRKQAMDQLHTVFKKRKIDLLMTPTTAITAPEITKDALNYGISDTKQLGFCTAFTTLANFTGVPAVSVPFGYHQGLPIGLQFIGAWYNEALLLRIAKACESLEENERKCPEHWFSKDLL